ncbi:tetratricopeptide repeat protein [Mucilaginibacter myungsuensis]|uniref:Tetratricopeptide repeat protein n=1 Tax=Mucilaginibacter myungsuensis TaxID=649104 RepID=A0A929L0Z8_9SPHI|nr:hypothetical protein [Mucilaginibacter myungsuensis]MBE9663593.1 hypothetical protein [Mucilaginibacter myungsuensis]MDN3599083.1 hypothetical protein [Mucilaginibacter myungsuensis]
MFKKYIIVILLASLCSPLLAQQNKSAFERYGEFNLARLSGETNAALDMGLRLMDSLSDLPAKSRIIYFNSMGRLYEDIEKPQKAIPFYEKVAEAEPNYYVVHRALGFIYITPANELYSQLLATKPADTAYVRLKTDYRAAALKAVKHLEVAQACDPDDDTLIIIKTLYKNIGDDAALAGLDERLKKLKKNCVDLLTE